MRTIISVVTGDVKFLLPNEEIPQNYVEIEEKYKKYIDPDGNIHTILKDATPGLDWTEYHENPFSFPDPNYEIPYQAKRSSNYPQVVDQLDMLWHELNTSGSISTNGTWFNSIKDIKDQFPKP
jgi:hypothetical protein